MMQKEEKTAINFRTVFLILFIVTSLVAAIWYADRKEALPTYIIVFCPPDTVPHPPYLQSSYSPKEYESA